MRNQVWLFRLDGDAATDTNMSSTTPEKSGSRRPGGPKEFCRPGVASANQDGFTEREKEREMEEEMFLLLIKPSVQQKEETTPVKSP